MVTILLNLKQLRFKIHTPEPEILKLSIKGERVVRAKDIEANANVEILTPDLPIATLDSNGEINMQLWVCRGRGYVPAEKQVKENYPADSLMLDALFSPVIKVHYDVENSRVGQVTDYDRLILDVWTDGSVAPGDAIAYSAKILKDSLSIFITFEEEPAPTAGQSPLPGVDRLPVYTRIQIRAAELGLGLKFIGKKPEKPPTPSAPATGAAPAPAPTQGSQ